MKLKDIVKIKGGKRLPKGENLQTLPNSHPYIRVKDMKDKYIVLDELEYVPDDVFLKIKNYIVSENDVLISIVGTIGEVCIIDKKLDGASQTENCAKLSGIDAIDAQYLYYFLKSTLGQEEIKKAIVGAVQPKLPLYGIENIEIDWKDRSKRESIVNSLATIDDKIHLNTQTNQTLEQIAQAIYKSWFVEYEPTRAKAAVLAAGGSKAEAESAAMRAISGKSAADLAALKQQHPARYQQLADLAAAFPAALTPTDNFGEIPEGWEYRKANELFDVGIGKTPPRKEEEWFSDSPGNVQWISIKDMGNSGTYVIDSSEYLTKEAVSKFNVRQIPENTVILSFKLTVGRVSITTTETTTNEAIAHFKITNKSCLTSEYLYLFLKNFDFDQLGSTSSIATAVNSKSVKNIFVLCPKKEIADLFQEHISGIFRQIKNLNWENKVLSEARDALLPKLLNGDFQDA